jgi:flagellar biosynthesis/type III secretory pathway protein FliH
MEKQRQTDEKLNTVNNRISILEMEMNGRTQKMEEELTSLRHQLKTSVEKLTAKTILSIDKPFDVDKTVVAVNIIKQTNETPESLRQECIHIVDDVLKTKAKIINCKRMGDRDTSHVIVKIEFKDTAQKVAMLRGKAMLCTNNKYSCVYICSSQTHCERVMNRNLQTMINAVPQLQHLKFLSNGNLVSVNNQHHSLFIPHC